MDSVSKHLLSTCGVPGAVQSNAEKGGEQAGPAPLSAVLIWVLIGKANKIRSRLRSGALREKKYKFE